ncbi:MAG TPA: histidine phosphatase family protein [Gammaproteobacteria bacterium]|nr:histidine phosphatase family protein [Gammaproteobacteria bacterium]
MTTHSRRLTLVRHAKSSWKHGELADFDRPLKKRGRGDAPRMGRRLAQQGLCPQLMVSSPARRALETARLMAPELGYPPDRIAIDRRIYAADADVLRSVIAGQAEAIAHLMLVGHNPALTDLCNRLTRAGIANLPSCGVVCVDFAVEGWSAVGHATGELVLFDYPKSAGQEDREGR